MYGAFQKRGCLETWQRDPEKANIIFQHLAQHIRGLFLSLPTYFSGSMFSVSSAIVILVKEKCYQKSLKTKKIELTCKYSVCANLSELQNVILSDNQPWTVRQWIRWVPFPWQEYLSLGVFDQIFFLTTEESHTPPKTFQTRVINQTFDSHMTLEHSWKFFLSL